MLFIICFLQITLQQEYLNDRNFQKQTLIAKHIPIADWTIAFCQSLCQDSDIKQLQLYNNTAMVNLQENEWLSSNFKSGIWHFYRNSTMCNQDQCSPIPQIYHYYYEDFLSWSLLDVHVGFIILIIFYAIVFKEIRAKLAQNKIDKSK